MVGFYSYIKIYNPLDDITKITDGIDLGDEDDIEDDPNATPFEIAKKKSNRINIIIVGLEHVRTDTIMVASFDRDTKEANIISVPRDTLIIDPEYKSGYVRINAIYQDDKIGGVIDAVQNILDIKIHRWVTVDYEAVIKGIDALGGIEMDIPFRMKYTDIYSDPPLYIDIPEGRRLLDGKTSVGFLRFRKGDDGYKGYVDGDIGRTRAQQKYVTEVIKKLISFKLPSVINEVYPYIKTNFSTSELIALAAESKDFSIDKLSAVTLPGNEDQKIKRETNSSYYALNKEEVIKIVYKMYGVLESNEANSNE
jgi:LCP family protein required for cell wall assembly